MTALSFFICLLIICWIEYIAYDKYESISTNIVFGLFNVFCGLIVSLLLIGLLNVVSSNYSAKYVYDTKMIEICAFSNSNVMKSTLFASNDNEYVYYNIKDANGYIYTEKIRMNRVKFKTDAQVDKPYLMIQYRRIKRHSWGYWFFNGDLEENRNTCPAVFVLKPDQISNRVMYDISRY